ncbi:hypothetical protein BB934_38250 (plasmid) [Microvirga ossetica]|uniref:LysR substrate-binding domain-containing protein n=1 Tax=Microvirga ossetica TaxID=1882682 RepID=A0A1B2EVX6_9HYPH|nr:hypothetical protein BB934_38250 [Microvirga ossetica]
MILPPCARRPCSDLVSSLLAVPDVLPQVDSGHLVRLVPCWYSDAGSISLYYTSRAFVDFIAEGLCCTDRLVDVLSPPQAFA